MQWIIFVARVISAAAALASAYGYIDSRFLDEEVLIGPFTVSDHFLGVVYIFGFMTGSIATIGLCWEWLSRWRPISRKLFGGALLGNLYQEITERRDELISAVDETDTTESYFSYYSKLVELALSLQKLDISYPDTAPNIANLNERRRATGEWIAFLIRLAARARERDIRGAREIMNKMPEYLIPETEDQEHSEDGQTPS